MYRRSNIVHTKVTSRYFSLHYIDQLGMPLAKTIKYFQLYRENPPRDGFRFYIRLKMFQY